MKKIITKSITVITILAIVLTMAMPMTAQAKTKAKPKLSKAKVTLTITNKKASPSATLKVKNAKKTVKWTTSNKKVATVKKTGKYTVKITAKKAGKATITCKVNGKKLKCKVTVVDKRTKKNSSNSNNNNKPATQDNNTPVVNSCQHTWAEHKATMYYTVCQCGKWFWATTGSEANDAWSMHSVEAALNGDTSTHSCSTGSEKYTDYKYCTKCGEKVTYDLPDKYK